MSEDAGKSKKVPKLRFPGFTDDWEQRRLGEVANIYDGTHQTPKYEKNGIMFLSVENIDTLKSDKYISEKAFKDEYKNYPQKNDILMTRIGDVGRVNIVETEELIAFYVSLALLKPFNIVSKFLLVEMQSSSFQRQLRRRTLVTAIPQKINKEEIGRITIFVPYEEEQRKIGHLLRRIDHHITFQQRKLEHLKERKKALLQKMFPKEGTNVPEIRFPGFTDAWEQRRLGEVCEIMMGQSPSSNNYSSEPCGYILVQGNADIEDGWVTPRVWTTEITKIGKCNDIIMSVRAPAGSVGRTKYDVVLGRGVAAIKGNNFVYRQLEKMEFCRYWKRLASGSTFESLSTAHLKSATIAIPEGREQMMIGNFFELLDHYITVQQRKLDHLKLRKKALLQQMFV